jgi:hypothetical protein
MIKLKEINLSYIMRNEHWIKKWYGISVDTREAAWAV